MFNEGRSAWKCSAMHTAPEQQRIQIKWARTLRDAHQAALAQRTAGREAA